MSNALSKLQADCLCAILAANKDGRDAYIDELADKLGRPDCEIIEAVGFLIAHGLATSEGAGSA